MASSELPYSNCRLLDSYLPLSVLNKMLKQMKREQQSMTRRKFIIRVIPNFNIKLA